MALYDLIKDGHLQSISENHFKLERELQQMIEGNLSTLFELEFVETEFIVGNYRLDTVAFNRELDSFVIIEYKKGKNFSVIDQGYAYLNTLISRKEAFVLAYNERFPDDVRSIKTFDWSQAKVIFISQEFTDYQYGAASNPELPIELVLVKRYGDGLIDVETMTKTVFKESQQDKELPNVIQKGLPEELKVYQESDQLVNSSEEIKELYEELRDSIINWDSQIKVVPNKLYNALKDKRNIVSIHAQKNQLKLWINLPSGKLNDPMQLARDVKGIGHWGTGDYELVMKNNDKIEYILSLIKQAWQVEK